MIVAPIQASARALVTGGSAGLGRALCSGLGEAGYGVTSVDRDNQNGEPQGRHIACDLSDRVALDAALPRIIARGPYDFVAFNAGVNATGRFEALPVAAMLALLRINAEAPMTLLSALDAANALAPGARLIFISSLSHFTGYPGAAAYAASKDAVAIYAASIAPRFARRGMHVMTVFPGPIRTTHAARHAPPGASAQKRMDPEKLAALILDAAARKRATLYPGISSGLAAIAGHLAPGLATHVMRRLLYDRLGGEVW